MRDDIRQARLISAHTKIAERHPHQEILWQAVRPVLVPVSAVVVVLGFLVLAGRGAAGVVSGGAVSGHRLVLGVVVFVVLAGAGLLVRHRNQAGVPRSWSKYM